MVTFSWEQAKFLTWYFPFESTQRVKKANKDGSRREFFLEHSTFCEVLIWHHNSSLRPLRIVCFEHPDHFANCLFCLESQVAIISLWPLLSTTSIRYKGTLNSFSLYVASTMRTSGYASKFDFIIWSWKNTVYQWTFYLPQWTLRQLSLHKR